MRVLLTGGGTGGHLFPLIAVMRQIKKNNSDAEFLFVGPSVLAKKIIDKEGLLYKFIFAGKIRRYASLANILDFFYTIIGFFQCLWLILIFMPDVIFSKGGYGAISAVVASWLYRVPIIIHESDSVAGLANKLAGRFATRIAISFPETAKFFPSQKTALTGNPVRKEILNGNKNEAKIMRMKNDSTMMVILQKISNNK